MPRDPPLTSGILAGGRPPFRGGGSNSFQARRGLAVAPRGGARGYLTSDHGLAALTATVHDIAAGGTAWPLRRPLSRSGPGAAAVTGIITRMRVLLASEPGRAGRDNEDFAAALPGAVVLLDGAGYVPPSGIGCVHGIAWYARTLGGLLAAGAADDRVPLPELLAQGIEQVSRMHGGACDLGHPATPGATVLVARQRGDTLEYLVLCDSVLLLCPRRGKPRAITDTMLSQTMARFRPDPAGACGRVRRPPG
jgi:hypothetical protein